MNEYGKITLLRELCVKKANMQDEVDNLLCSLTYRERKVIELRLEGYTLKEIAKIYSVTRERVQSVETKAKKKIDYLEGI